LHSFRNGKTLALENHIDGIVCSEYFLVAVWHKRDVLIVKCRCFFIVYTTVYTILIYWCQWHQYSSHPWGAVCTGIWKM